jgi:hypothetical protein
MDTVLNLNDTGAENPLRTWARRSARVLMEPARFFRVDYPALDTPTIVALGVGNAWLASVAAFFVQTINSFLVAHFLDRWMQRIVASEDGLSVWGLSPKGFLFTSGVTLLGPFFFVFEALLGAFGLYLFSRLLIEDRDGAPEPVTYTAALRIRSTALVAEWYSLVPVFGGVLSAVATLVLLVTGVRERFGVSTRRASAVVLAPYFLALVVVLFFAAFTMLLLTQVPLQDLLDTESLGI